MNPEHCLHLHAELIDFDGHSVYVTCPVCGIHSETIRIKWFRWWANAKAYRSFYSLANQIDREVLNARSNSDAPR